jgi:hypothetical protein
MQEPENPFFIKGNCAHDTAATFITGTGRPPLLIKTLPTADGQPIKMDLRPVKAMLVDLRKRKAKAELEWAFDRQWIPVDWRDWDRAWLRIKTDVCADSVKPPTVDIVDWKTGKVHPEHAQQRSLYALGGLQLVQIGKLAGGSKDVKLTAQHVYVDTGQSATENYVMKDLAPLKREWMTRIKEMMADTEYRPNPGHACRWCKFSKLKGGPCKEG